MQQTAEMRRPRSARDGAELSAAVISAMGPEDLDLVLGPEKARKVSLLSDWLVRHSRDVTLPVETINYLCEQLIDIGLPLDRFGSSTETLDAEHDAIGRIWVRGQGVTERIYVKSEDESRFLNSPFYLASQTRKWVELWLPTTDDSRFGVVAEFKAAGFVHYLCIPLLLLNGAEGWITLATRSASGFSEADLAAIARLLPAVAVLIDLRSTWISLDKLLRTYVGDEPHRAILRGNTKRGQVSTIQSAMLFADMRNSVGHTIDLGAVGAVAVFNALFDCLVPPIESRRGEVLKYIGDGLLAIFRDKKEEESHAVERALAAAKEALHILQAHNIAHPNERPIHVGIALHYGEAAYGNVGSGVRLDFTVIGKDVGLASRIANMNRTLDEPLLMSAAFVERLPYPATRLGAFAARGFAEPVEVFRPDDASGA